MMVIPLSMDCSVSNKGCEIEDAILFDCLDLSFEINILRAHFMDFASSRISGYFCR